MAHAGGIEMRAGGFEVGRLAFRELVNVNRMIAGRQVLDIEFDADALGRGRENGGADILALSILEVDGHGFYGVGMGLLCSSYGEGEEKQESRQGRSHEGSFR